MKRAVIFSGILFLFLFLAACEKETSVKESESAVDSISQFVADKHNEYVLSVLQRIEPTSINKVNETKETFIEIDIEGLSKQERIRIINKLSSKEKSLNDINELLNVVDTSSVIIHKSGFKEIIMRSLQIV